MKGIHLSYKMPAWDGCPKCSAHILNGEKEQKEHNEKCKSTAIEDAVTNLSDSVDRAIISITDNMIKQTRRKK